MADRSVRGRGGKFAGSVGAGRDQVPTPPRIPGAFTGHPDAPRPQPPLERAVERYRDAVEARTVPEVPQGPAAPQGPAQGQDAPPPPGLARNNPLWMSARTRREAVAASGLIEEAQPLAEKTYLHTYRKAWAYKYTQQPEGPRTAQEAWQWRDDCSRRAAQAIAGAEVLRGSQVRPGMVIRRAFNSNSGEQTVCQVKGAVVKGVRRPGGIMTGSLAAGHPDAETLRVLYVTVDKGRKLDGPPLESDEPVVRFPGLERD